MELISHSLKVPWSTPHDRVAHHT